MKALDRADASGNGNTGAIGTAAWLPTGKYGNASFNGTHARVTVNDSASLDLNGDDIGGVGVGVPDCRRRLARRDLQEPRRHLLARGLFGFGCTGGRRHLQRSPLWDLRRCR